MNEPFTLMEENWLFRVQPATETIPKAVMIALHGWTGNETSMEIFTRKLRQTAWMIHPRAPFASQSGGYSWTSETKGVLQEFSTFKSVGGDLHHRLKRIIAEYHLKELPVHWIGFSQGAAATLVNSLESGLHSSKVGILSGFLPVDMPSDLISPLPEYFIAHGRQDAIVPIDHAYQVVRYLEEQKAKVSFCEADTGHKLNTACFKQLEYFFLHS